MSEVIIKEGKAKISIEKRTKISSEMPVFYNPKMKSNRDTTVLFINAINSKKFELNFNGTKRVTKKIRKIILPMAASGIRALRIALETDVKDIIVNDISEKAINAIKKNIDINIEEILKNNTKFIIKNEDASILLRKIKVKDIDYIDIDPFGSPNPFLDSAIANKKYVYLAITSTDTSGLAGSYKNACLRKYWALPLHNHLMHEIGLRILIRKIQLIASQYSIAAVPLVSYYKDHYYRIFFFLIPNKNLTDHILKMHKYILYNKETTQIQVYDINELINLAKHEQNQDSLILAGQAYVGKINHHEIIKEMLKHTHETHFSETKNFVARLYYDALADEKGIIGFYDLHAICKKFKFSRVPKLEKVMDELRKKGFFATRTTFSNYGIKTTASHETITKIMNEFGK